MDFPFLSAVVWLDVILLVRHAAVLVIGKGIMEILDPKANLKR